MYKKGVGAEDCLISLCYDITIASIVTTTMLLVDSRMYDSQHQLIIQDKFRYHAGFTNKYNWLNQ